MKLIVTTAAHGIKTGEYTGDALSQLMQKNRYGVTSLVSRGQARWQHKDQKPAADPAPVTGTPVKADKPTD